MKKSRLLGAMCASVFCLVSLSAGATTIVDTGMGSLIPGTNYWSVDDVQWLAGEFTVSSDTSIDSIEGFMGSNVGGPEGTIAIYTDGGEIPGAELFSTAFSLGSRTQPMWVGASGLAWDLTAGTYWVSFEVRSGQTLHGTMAGAAENPLSGYAAKYSPFGTFEWIEADTLDIGVRIMSSPVPIPAAFWLFGSGLLGLVGMARRKKA